jgi:hypothetical protein
MTNTVSAKRQQFGTSNSSVSGQYHQALVLQIRNPNPAQPEPTTESNHEIHEAHETAFLSSYSCISWFPNWCHVACDSTRTKRSPKPETNPNIKWPKAPNAAPGSGFLVMCALVLWVCFEYRISDFCRNRMVVPARSALRSRPKRGRPMRLSYSQQTFVRGCREPAASAFLEQPRQMPSAAHVQARRDPG